MGGVPHLRLKQGVRGPTFVTSVLQFSTNPYLLSSLQCGRYDMGQVLSKYTTVR